MSEPFDEMDALRQQLAENKELTSVAVKAAISALLAVEELLNEARHPRPRGLPRGLLDGPEPLDLAEAHVKRGLEVLRKAFEDAPDGT